MSGPTSSSDQPKNASGLRLASVVIFVRDLDTAIDFYRTLLIAKLAIKNLDAALLTSALGSQIYLRSVGSRTEHALGSVGVQYAVWTATDEEDLRRCERFLKDESAHIRTSTADGFTVVEGRDPSGTPVVISYPGPDRSPRSEVAARVYAW